MLSMTPLLLIYLIKGSLTLSDFLHPIPHPHHLYNHKSDLFFYKFVCFWSITMNLWVFIYLMYYKKLQPLSSWCSNDQMWPVKALHDASYVL